MTKGYISDAKARLMGLHKVPRPIVSSRISGRSVAINPAHMARVIRTMLKGQKGDRIEIGRQLAIDCAALCDAIARITP